MILSPYNNIEIKTLKHKHSLTLIVLKVHFYVSLDKL